MEKKKVKKKEKKITNEKPVSLNPLGFKDALKGLLATPPPTKSTEKKA